MFANMPVIVHVALILIVIGLILSLINRYIPMAGSIKSILNAVVVIVVIVWLLNVFGLVTTFPRIHVGKVRSRFGLREFSEGAGCVLVPACAVLPTHANYLYKLCLKPRCRFRLHCVSEHSSS